VQHTITDRAASRRTVSWRPTVSTTAVTASSNYAPLSRRKAHQIFTCNKIASTLKFFVVNKFLLKSTGSSNKASGAKWHRHTHVLKISGHTSHPSSQLEEKVVLYWSRFRCDCSSATNTTVQWDALQSDVLTAQPSVCQCVRIRLLRASNRPLGRRRNRWDDNLKLGSKPTGADNPEGINLAQGTNKRRSSVNAALKCQVPYNLICRANVSF